MSEYLIIKKTNLTEIADAIRNKTMSADKITYQQLHSTVLDAINNSVVNHTDYIHDIVDGIQTWDKLNLDSYIKYYIPPYDNIILLSDNKNAYFSYPTADNLGLWHVDLDTKKVTKIYENGYNWLYWHETKKGELFISCNSATEEGILYIDGINATQIYSYGNNWEYFYESSEGDVYASSNSSSYQGILYLTPTSATLVFNEGYYYSKGIACSSSNDLYMTCDGITSSYFSGTIHLLKGVATKVAGYLANFEEIGDYVYAWQQYSSDGGGFSILKGSTRTYYSSSGYRWTIREILSDNSFYVATTYGKSVTLYIQGDKVSEVHSSKAFSNFNVTPSGKIYAIMDSSIYLLNGTNYTLVENSSGIAINLISKNEDIYASASASSSILGIYKIEGTVASLIYNEGKNYKNWFETSDGTIYASPDSTAQKTIQIKNGVATPILEHGSIKYFVELNDGVVYLIAGNNGTTSPPYGVYCVNIDNTVQPIAYKLVKGPYISGAGLSNNTYFREYQYYAITHEGLLLADTSAPTTTSRAILIKNKTQAYLLDMSKNVTQESEKSLSQILQEEY